MSVRQLGVWLLGEHVAVLRAPRIGRVTCQYDAAVLDEQLLNTPLLSCSLPTLTGKRDAWAFVTGLLPVDVDTPAVEFVTGRLEKLLGTRPR